MTFDEYKIETQKALKIAEKERLNPKTYFIKSFIKKDFDAWERFNAILKNYEQDFQNATKYGHDFQVVLNVNDTKIRVILDCFREPKFYFMPDGDYWEVRDLKPEEVLELIPETVFMIDEIG